MKIAVAAIFCISAVACFAEDEFPVPTFENLKDWYTGYYEDARYLILQKEGILEELEELHRNTDDWHIKVICEAFIYRKRNPEKVTLLDRKWGIEFKAHRGHPEYGMVLLIHFGSETAPLVAEKILHTWRRESAHSQSMALLALSLMRYRFTPEILLKAVSDNRLQPEADRMALSIAKDCLDGFRALKFSVGRHTLEGDIMREVTRYMLPEELRRFRNNGEISVPALSIEGERREKFVQGLLDLLDYGDTFRKANTIDALRDEPTPAVVEHLSDLLTLDRSPVVRARCAYALRSLGTDEALTAVEKARRTEKDPSVLSVLERKNTPTEVPDEPQDD